jgi:hypothetical protein
MIKIHRQIFIESMKLQEEKLKIDTKVETERTKVLSENAKRRQDMIEALQTAVDSSNSELSKGLIISTLKSSVVPPEPTPLFVEPKELEPISFSSS